MVGTIIVQAAVPDTWGIASTETNFFIRDVTNGSDPFIIRQGAPTSSIYVATSGNVGIGTDSPDRPVEIHGDDIVALKMVNTLGGVAFRLDADDDGNFWNMTARSPVGMDTHGDFVINSNDGPGSVELRLNNAGDLTIEGEIITNSCPAGCGDNYAHSNQSCPAGQVVTGFDANGNVICANDAVGPSISCNWGGAVWISHGWDGPNAFRTGINVTCTGGTVTNMVLTANASSAFPAPPHP